MESLHETVPDLLIPQDLIGFLLKRPELDSPAAFLKTFNRPVDAVLDGELVWPVADNLAANVKWSLSCEKHHAFQHYIKWVFFSQTWRVLDVLTVQVANHCFGWRTIGRCDSSLLHYVANGEKNIHNFWLCPYKYLTLVAKVINAICKCVEL